MNWKKIFTIAALTGFSASVATGQGTATTILEGSYISNVFGQSNFIKNPNAKLNTKDVTTVTATVTRSTTTPLVATSEFTVAIGTANGTATWATRAFDAGMKGQNCEARFTYRGFAATSKVHIKQGANTVATLNLTPATDPRIASINFPCGDLSTATTFVVTDTAILAGTNEIGGIYVGLATNMANVAQAEFVGGISYAANAACQWSRLGDGTWANFASDTDCSPTPIGVCSNASNVPGASCNLSKPGRYEILVQQRSRLAGQSSFTGLFRISDGTNNGPTSLMYQAPNIASYDAMQTQTLTASFEYTSVPGTKTIQVQSLTSSTNTMQIYGNESSPVWEMKIYRFPTSSELVVTPERQNTFGGVVYTAGTQTIKSGTLGDGNYFEFNSATWNQPTMLKGKAAVTTTNSGNDFGFSIPNMPVGNYQVSLSGLIQTDTGAAPGAVAQNTAICNFKIRETTIGVDVAKQSHQDRVFNTTPFLQTRDWTNSFTGIFSNTSVGTRNFRLEANKLSDNTPGSISGCQVYASTGSSLLNTNLSFLLTPLDQPSNSALYVEGPVKAAATGAAIPASYVGEEKIAYATDTSTVTANSEVDVTGASITLDPGVWELQYSASVLIERTPASTNSIQCRLRIRDSTNNVESSTESGVGLYSSTSDVSWNFLEMSKTKRINITSSKTFKLSATSSQNNAIANCTIYNGSTSGSISGNEATSYIRAVRVN